MDHSKFHDIAPAKGHASWMVSLADLLALMLTFFVLLFSMNAVQLDDWRAVVESFRQEFNPQETRVAKDEIADAQAQRHFVPWAVSLEYLTPLFSHQLAKHGLEGASVQLRSDRLVVSLPVDDLFTEGSARLAERGQSVIADFAVQLSRIGNDVALASSSTVGAHSNSAYRSDWELSLRRSEAVGAFLEKSGFDRPLIAVGLGPRQAKAERANGQKPAMVHFYVMAWSGGQMHAH